MVNLTLAQVLALRHHPCKAPASGRSCDAEEWDQARWQLVGELLDEVGPCLEPTDCTLIADRGLAGSPLVQLRRDRKFHDLLRARAKPWPGSGTQPD